MSLNFDATFFIKILSIFKITLILSFTDPIDSEFKIIMRTLEHINIGQFIQFRARCKWYPKTLTNPNPKTP